MDNKDSVCLLKECNMGSKAGTSSMEQVEEYVKEEKLMKIIDSCNKKLIKIGEECHDLLHELGAEDKDPSMIQKAYAYASTEMKMMLNDDSQKIAKLMMDGCNMGIQSISEAINKYPEASKESVSVAKKLIKIQEDFMNDLTEFR